MRTLPENLLPLSHPHAGRGEVIDVLERVLTRGIVFEIVDLAGSNRVNRTADEWFRLSPGGVDILRVEGNAHWGRLVGWGIHDAVAQGD